MLRVESDDEVEAGIMLAKGGSNKDPIAANGGVTEADTKESVTDSISKIDGHDNSAPERVQPEDLGIFNKNVNQPMSDGDNLVKSVDPVEKNGGGGNLSAAPIPAHSKLREEYVETPGNKESLQSRVLPPSADFVSVVPEAEHSHAFAGQSESASGGNGDAIEVAPEPVEQAPSDPVEYAEQKGDNVDTGYKPSTGLPKESERTISVPVPSEKEMDKQKIPGAFPESASASASEEALTPEKQRHVPGAYPTYGQTDAGVSEGMPESPVGGGNAVNPAEVPTTVGEATSVTEGLPKESREQMQETYNDHTAAAIPTQQPLSTTSAQDTSRQLSTEPKSFLREAESDEEHSQPLKNAPILNQQNSLVGTGADPARSQPAGIDSSSSAPLAGGNRSAQNTETDSPSSRLETAPLAVNTTQPLTNVENKSIPKPTTSSSTTTDGQQNAMQAAKVAESEAKPSGNQEIPPLRNTQQDVEKKQQDATTSIPTLRTEQLTASGKPSTGDREVPTLRDHTHGRTSQDTANSKTPGGKGSRNIFKKISKMFKSHD